MTQGHLIIRCNACQAKNRVPVSRLNERPVCGKCGKAISASGIGAPQNVSDSNFDVEVLQSDIPVLVDCWAPWCGPCRGFAPVLESVAASYSPRLKVTKINVDENPVISSRYRIQSVPTLLLVKNGQVVDQIAGALSQAQLETRLDYFLG